MSRNASGTHSLPTGNPVVVGTIADPVVHNATNSDLSAEITDSLSRSGKGGMSAPLVVTAGTAALPAIVPTGDTDTGIYSPGANEIAISTGGTQRIKASSAGANVTGAMAATGAVSGTTGTFTGAVSGTTGTFTGAGSFGGPVDMNSQKITELANGTAATDAVNVGQVAVVGAFSLGTDWSSGIPIAVKLAAAANGLVVGRLSVTAGAGSAWASIATFPAGYRPDSEACQFPCVVTDATGPTVYGGVISVATSGVVSLAYYDNGTAMVAPFTIGTGDKVESTFAFRSA